MTDPLQKRAALEEMLALAGKDTALADRYMAHRSLKVVADHGRASGQWWPRAELPEGEEITPSPSEVMITAGEE